MDLSAYNVWGTLIQISILLVAIIFATLLRRKVKFVKNSLLPSSVIAGIIIFILKFIPTVNEFIDNSFMEVVTYHCLGLGFIALALKSKEKDEGQSKLVIMDTGIVTVNTYLVQALIGLGLSLVLSVTLFKDFFYSAGLLLPMGFGQGTGQALNIGTVFENFGFENGRGFGLAIAAIGFLVACLVGVLYLNYLRKTGKLKVQEARIADNKLDTNIYDEKEAPLNESVDKLTIQVGIILFVYIIVYLVILGTSTLAVNYLGNFGKNTIKPLLWGFNFLFGSLFGMLIRKVFNSLHAKNVMKHKWLNNYYLNRLSGFFFDIMIVAGIAAIDWQNLQGVLWPLIIICVFGTIGTFAYVKFVCKKLYPDYEYEAFFAMFGMLTGTASTGMILLREIDPNYETPAANNLVLQQVPAVAFGAPLLLLMSFAAETYTNALISFAIFAGMFIVYNIIILRKWIFKKKNKTKE